jgi:YhcH/YjgK/YiaL family protein
METPTLVMCPSIQISQELHMIFDRVSELKTYKGISKNLDAAIEYLVGIDVETLQDGEYPIDGDEVVAKVMSYDTKPLSDMVFEAHRRYIDVQLPIEGEETCYYAPLRGLAETGPFDEKKDAGLYKGADGMPLVLARGNFAIFFPQDAHMPSRDAKGKSAVRKIVVKVAV